MLIDDKLRLCTNTIKLHKTNFVHLCTFKNKELKQLNLSCFWVIPFDKTSLLILSWFFSTKLFKKILSNLSYLSKLKPHKNQKCAKFVSVYWTYIRISEHVINGHNDQVCEGIEPALLYLAAGLKQSLLTIDPKRHTSVRNKEKCIDTLSNFVTAGKKFINLLTKLEYRLYTYCSSSMKYKTIVHLKHWYF